MLRQNPQNDENMVSRLAFLLDTIATEWQHATSALRSMDRDYARYVAEAEEKGNWEEVERRRSEWTAMRKEEQDAVDRLATMYWRKKAARRRIPEPPYGDPRYWEENPLGVRFLTVEGIDFIETRIYEKRKRRWEFWFTAIPSMTGVIGALIGLLAILRH